jgi:chromosome segregation protein
MKLAYVDLCGFRGYQKAVRFEFAEGFTIIDGRNGVGKSTIFDAIEFALTGTITKYLDARASGESVSDYIWWNGESTTITERYVEIGFSDGYNTHSIRRTPRDNILLDVSRTTNQLVDQGRAPKGAIAQLCAATIIRDEHIARLSLDLKEGERFTLLRDAIGATDADEWISRAQKLVSAAAARLKSAQSEVDEANAALQGIIRQIDQARSALPAAALVLDATARLQANLSTTQQGEKLSVTARERVARINGRVELLTELNRGSQSIKQVRTDLIQLNAAVRSAIDTLKLAEEEFKTKDASVVGAPGSSELSKHARQLEQLVALGRELGLHDGACPLCVTKIDHEHFQSGMESALTLAKHLDAEAVLRATRERERELAEAIYAQARERLQLLTARQLEAQASILDFEQRCAEANLKEPEEGEISKELSGAEIERTGILADLRILEAMSVSSLLAKAIDDEQTARARISRVELRVGRARLAESRAKAIHDAARRAAAETLDQRLDRVLPLMAELYKRMRPHPIWQDIEYSIRGDVRRFLKLQVGNQINPQFVFSSGQRRATGLAFLLSLNLSIAWSRWKSILLDDPVQHVDDYRTVNLAEVLSHLCAGGRQIICAVEDSALADLMCRRLPKSGQHFGKRISLGTEWDGALAIGSERYLPQLNPRVFATNVPSLSA